MVLTVGGRGAEPPITMGKHGVHHALGRTDIVAKQLNSWRRSNRGRANLDAVAEAVLKALLVSRRSARSRLLCPRLPLEDGDLIDERVNLATTRCSVSC